MMVRGLSCQIEPRRGRSTGRSLSLLRNIDFELASRERAGLVGDSGAGKSTMLRALLGLFPHRASSVGTLTLDHNGTSTSYPFASAERFASLRGRVLAIVPQDAATSLDPVRRVGAQLRELVAVHGSAESPRELLEHVDLTAEALDRFPHELSGGMARRVALAMALAGRPKVVLADEPTAGLDPLTCTTVLDELARVCDRLDASLLLASHDSRAIARLCQRIIRLEQGQIA